MRRMSVAVAAATLIAGLSGLWAGCGGRPPIPKRGVVESDLGSWRFRRFQGPLLDHEVWIEKNNGVAFSASYITADAEKRGHIDDKDLVNVTVTRYDHDDGVVRATVKLARRLAAEDGYQVEESKIGGARALSIVGHGEAWVMWPSTKHVVKVGGRGRVDVPTAMVESYADRYPSRLPGGSLSGPLPPGPDSTPRPKDKFEYDSNNPRPNLDNYDPNKVKLPEAAKPEVVKPDPDPEPDPQVTDDPDEPEPVAKPKSKKKKKRTKSR
jgi:hypothetical protein